MTRNEALIFIQKIGELPLMQRLMYSLLLTTGIRRGECFGLQWQDIDFEYRTGRVQRNVIYTSKSGIVVGLPKSDCGLREIPLTENVLALLKRYREEEAPSDKEMFLFHDSESQYKPHDPTYLTKHLKKFMKNAGLPDMSPHDLRHTCASILLQSGADIKSVQDILGHADASTTLNYYVKSDLESMRGATEKAFGNAF